MTRTQPSNSEIALAGTRFGPRGELMITTHIDKQNLPSLSVAYQSLFSTSRLGMGAVTRL
jgi:hypothetical protein